MSITQGSKSVWHTGEKGLFCEVDKNLLCVPAEQQRVGIVPKVVASQIRER
jgi:hypothetical protein